MYFHNLTRDVRLSWKAFPKNRKQLLNTVNMLFINWARIGEEGIKINNFPLVDKNNIPICRRFLFNQCTTNKKLCNLLHADLHFDKEELKYMYAYIIYDDYNYFLSYLYGPKFVWKYELYLSELFHGYSVDKDIFFRTVSKTCCTSVLILIFVSTARIIILMKVIVKVTVVVAAHYLVLVTILFVPLLSSLLFIIVTIIIVLL